MQENNKSLIIKIVVLVLIISSLIVVLFFFLKKEEKIVLNPEDIKVKESMLQLTFVAENFKEENGYYNNSSKEVDNNFCQLKETNFAGVGNGHILCSNIVNKASGEIGIKMNSNKEETSKYCIIKEISERKFWCIDYKGYSGIASNCGENYECKQ